jgi:hypothetical protein
LIADAKGEESPEKLTQQSITFLLLEESRVHAFELPENAAIGRPYAPGIVHVSRWHGMALGSFFTAKAARRSRK